MNSNVRNKPTNPSPGGTRENSPAIYRWVTRRIWNKSRQGREKSPFSRHVFFRPYRAPASLRPRPTVETVGYSRSSLTGLRYSSPSVKSVSSIGLWSRVTRFEPRAFPQRARDAGQREIVHDGFATGSHWHDVVNVKGRFLAGLRKPAILATTLRALDDQTPQMRRDGHVLTLVDCLIAVSAGEVMKEFQLDRPDLRPPVFQRMLAADLGLACRAEREAAFERLWAVETGRGRPAFAARLGWLGAYLVSVSQTNVPELRRRVQTGKSRNHEMRTT